MKYLNSTQKNITLKSKNGPLQLEKDFKPINIFVDDMDKFK